MKFDGRAVAGIPILVTILACGMVGNRTEHYNVSFDVSPDGNFIVFSAVDEELYLLDLRSRHLECLTNTKETERKPAFSPDGKSIAYSISKGDGFALRLMSLKDLKVMNLTDEAQVSDSSPAFSPDGNQIAFDRASRLRNRSMGGRVWTDHEIYIVKPDGKGLTRLTKRRYTGLSGVGFSPDSTAVIFSAGVAAGGPGGTVTSVARVLTDGSNKPKILAPIPENPHGGAWASDPYPSRDGEWITFISDREDSYAYDVWVMRADGSDVRPLHITNISRYNQNPVFTPDGKRIFFLAGTETNAGGRAIYSLWQVDIDGSNAKRVVTSGLFSDPYTWNKDPAKP